MVRQVSAETLCQCGHPWSDHQHGGWEATRPSWEPKHPTGCRAGVGMVDDQPLICTCTKWRPVARNPLDDLPSAESMRNPDDERIRRLMGEERYAELVEKGEQSMYLGTPLARLGRETLLAIVGHIGEYRQPATEYRHAEAFCLMWYHCKTCGGRLRVWNSRDGVTPFGMRCRAGGGCEGRDMVHIAWHLDECRPDHVPEEGDLVFVDMTEEALREIISARVEAHWDEHGMSEAFTDKAGARRALFEGEWREGAPNVIRWKPDAADVIARAKKALLEADGLEYEKRIRKRLGYGPAEAERAAGHFCDGLNEAARIVGALRR